MYALKSKTVAQKGGGETNEGNENCHSKSTAANEQFCILNSLITFQKFLGAEILLF